VRRRSRDIPAGERDAHEHDVRALRVGEHLAVGQVDPSVHRSASRCGELARHQGTLSIHETLLKRPSAEGSISGAHSSSNYERNCNPPKPDDAYGPELRRRHAETMPTSMPRLPKATGL
jgi:hypothetical protein